MLDVNSLSAAFITDSISSTSSPLISVLWKVFAFGPAKSLNQPGLKIPDNVAGEFLFVLTKDARIYVVDGNNGKRICSRPVHPKKQSSAITMYVIGKYCLSMAKYYLYFFLYLFAIGFFSFSLQISLYLIHGQ